MKSVVNKSPKIISKNNLNFFSTITLSYLKNNIYAEYEYQIIFYKNKDNDKWFNEIPEIINIPKIIVFNKEYNDAKTLDSIIRYFKIEFDIDLWNIGDTFDKILKEESDKFLEKIKLI